MNIDQARMKAVCNHMTLISIDNKPFIPLIEVKRRDAISAGDIRVMLSKRRSRRIHFFLDTYADKITILDLMPCENTLPIKPQYNELLIK